MATASQQISDRNSRSKRNKSCNNKKVLKEVGGTVVFLYWKSTEKSTKVLNISTLPAIEEYDFENMWFQQDGATCHISSVAKYFQNFQSNIVLKIAKNR